MQKMLMKDMNAFVAPAFCAMVYVSRSLWLELTHNLICTEKANIKLGCFVYINQ